MGIKEQIPDIATLELLIVKRLPQIKERAAAATASYSEDYFAVMQRRLQALKVFKKAVVFFIGALIVFSILPAVAPAFMGWIGLLVSLVLVGGVIGLIVYLVRSFKDPEGVVTTFNSALSRSVFDDIVSIFSLSGTYMPAPHNPSSLQDLIVMMLNKESREIYFRKSLAAANSDNNQQVQVKDMLDHSELFKGGYDVLTVDDMYHIDWGESQPLFIAELKLQQTQHERSANGNTRTKRVEVFRGLFVSFDLTKTLTGRTFVVADKHATHMKLKSFFGNLEEVNLEWNDFEDLLHVVADNQAEARYVLTPNMMADLHDWWEEKQYDIRLGFKANRLYMMFPQPLVRINNTIVSFDDASIQDYVESVAGPLMHVLHIIEEVRL